MAYSDGTMFPAGLYATAIDGVVYRITAPNTFSAFATGLPFERWEPALDPTGSFGGDLFVAAVKRGSGAGDSLMRIDSLGNVTVFFDGGAEQLDTYASAAAFGPGNSEFGDDLYALDYARGCLDRFDPAASRTSMGDVSLSSTADFIDFEFSREAWGSYAFISDAPAHQILRMAPDGTSDVFFTWDPPEHANIRTIAFGDGGVFGDDLYAGDNGGMLTRIGFDGTETLLVSGLGHKVKGSEFGDNQLFVSTIAGDIYRVTEIPEPTTLLIAALAALTAKRRV